MKLIDTDKLIEDLYLNAYACTNDEVNKILHKQLESNIEVINNQPTAYDVDKVIEQLEDELRYISLIEGLNYMEFKEAIDVVKAGGIDDN